MQSVTASSDNEAHSAGVPRAKKCKKGLDKMAGGVI